MRNHSGRTAVKIREIASTIIAGTMVFLLSQPALAENLVQRQVENQEPVSQTELRDLLIQFADLMDGYDKKTGAAAKMRERIDSLEPEALEYLYKFSGNWKKLRIAVALMYEAQEKGKTALATPLRSSARLVEPQNSAGLPADLFAPGYPVGSN